MTKEEFLAGLPFKMQNNNDLQSVYSFVSVSAFKCIQEYTILAPSDPKHHCNVMHVSDTGITVKGSILGKGITLIIPFHEMHLIGDAFGKPKKRLNNDN